MFIYTSLWSLTLIFGQLLSTWRFYRSSSGLCVVYQFKIITQVKYKAENDLCQNYLSEYPEKWNSYWENTNKFTKKHNIANISLSFADLSFTSFNISFLITHIFIHYITKNPLNKLHECSINSIKSFYIETNNIIPTQTLQCKQIKYLRHSLYSHRTS